MPEYKPNERTQRALAAYTNLVRATDTVVSALTRQLASFGLTMGQFRALEALLHLGPMSQVILADKMFTSENNASAVAAKLEKRGLVSRERQEKGSVRVTVRLTPEGQKLIEKVFPLHATVIRAGMSALNGRELKTLRNLCRKLGQGDAAKFMREVKRGEAGVEWEL